MTPLVSDIARCHDFEQNHREEVSSMSKRNERIAVLAGAVIGAAVLNKIASKEAKALGMSAGVLAVVVWAVSQAI